MPKGSSLPWIKQFIWNTCSRFSLSSTDLPVPVNKSAFFNLCVQSDSFQLSVLWVQVGNYTVTLLVWLTQQCPINIKLLNHIRNWRSSSDEMKHPQETRGKKEKKTAPVQFLGTSKKENLESLILYIHIFSYSYIHIHKDFKQLVAQVYSCWINA